MLKADEALKKLLDGNKRFVNFDKQPVLTKEQRKNLIEKQTPYALVITCSDSRVCPEIIFDCNLGEIFTVRIASGSLHECLLGSIEYAILNLGVELVVLMGHDNCGVMGAILDTPECLSSDIKKMCCHVGRNLTEEQKETFSNTQGVKFVTNQDVSILEKLPVLQERFQNNTLKIVGAHYSFETNKVEVFE